MTAASRKRAETGCDWEHQALKGGAREDHELAQPPSGSGPSFATAAKVQTRVDRRGRAISMKSAGAGPVASSVFVRTQSRQRAPAADAGDGPVEPSAEWPQITNSAAASNPTISDGPREKKTAVDSSTWASSSQAKTNAPAARVQLARFSPQFIMRVFIAMAATKSIAHSPNNGSPSVPRSRGYELIIQAYF